jgi:hypothetical protein
LNETLLKPASSRPILTLGGLKPRPQPEPVPEPAPASPPVIKAPPERSERRKQKNAEFWAKWQAKRERWFVIVAEMFADTLPAEEREAAMKWALEEQRRLFVGSFKKKKLKGEVAALLGALWSRRAGVQAL